MDRAAELRQQLRAAWSEMSIPKLRPPPEDGYLDYRDTYPAVNGQRWEDLNLGPTGELMPLWNDCWIEDLFEAEAKIYYFAAFLDYCLKFYEAYRRGDEEVLRYPYGDMPFTCTIHAARRLLDDGSAACMTPLQLRTTIAILEFVNTHWDVYGLPDYDEDNVRFGLQKDYGLQQHQTLQAAINGYKSLLSMRS